jgi:site-specific DNA recombinase
MTMNSKQPRVAIYTRVSSQEQAAEGVSIEAQVAALRAYAKSQSWEIADEYIDGGFSGSTDDRPALRRLLIDASRRRFSIVAVCKLDRFFRNLRLLLNHLHGLEQLGIKFVSTQEGLDTSTPYGKFAVQIMGVIAEFGRGRIGERVRDSRRYLVSGGNWLGGRTLYGFRWFADERRWEVVPGEAEIVRHVYDLYVRKNLGIDAITTSLNADGVITRNGAKWRISSIRQILVHPGYKGRHQIGIPMPPIIDESTWQQAQKKREDARSILADPKGRLLQCICFCGRCGHVLKCLRKRPGESGIR